LASSHAAPRLFVPEIRPGEIVRNPQVFGGFPKGLLKLLGGKLVFAGTVISQALFVMFVSLRVGGHVGEGQGLLGNRQPSQVKCHDAKKAPQVRPPEKAPMGMTPFRNSLLILGQPQLLADSLFARRLGLFPQSHGLRQSLLCLLFFAHFLIHLVQL